MLRDKVAVVTGAGKGIGRSIAVALAHEGCKLVVADIHAEAAEDSASTLRRFGGAVAVECDVSVPADVANLFVTALDKFGRVDILVNNAGIVSVVPTIEVTLEQWQKVLAVNLTGVFLCCQAAAKVMIPAGGGRIINIASAGAHVAAPEFAAYDASKAGVVALTRVLALEWAKNNILVNSISPGSIETDLSRESRLANPELFARRDARIPLQRLAEVEDVASVVTFLASGGSSYITGRDLVVDGGMLAQHPGYVP